MGMRNAMHERPAAINLRMKQGLRGGYAGRPEPRLERSAFVVDQKQIPNPERPFVESAGRNQKTPWRNAYRKITARRK